MRVTYICTATVVRSTALHGFWVVPRLIKGKRAVQKNTYILSGHVRLGLYPPPPIWHKRTLSKNSKKNLHV